MVVTHSQETCARNLHKRFCSSILFFAASDVFFSLFSAVKVNSIRSLSQMKIASILIGAHISRVNCASFDPLHSRSSRYRCIKFGYPLENARFRLLSTNLTRERLQIDTDLLLIITSTADELSGGTNIDDLERPLTRKIWIFDDFFAILGYDAHLWTEFSPKLLEIDQDNLRTKSN